MTSDKKPADAGRPGIRHRVAGKLRNRLRIAPFIGLSVLVAGFSMLAAVVFIDLLAAGRAYVAGESHWSKAHHSTIFHLDRFAESGDPELLRMPEISWKCRSPIVLPGWNSTNRNRTSSVPGNYSMGAVIIPTTFPEWSGYSATFETGRNSRAPSNSGPKPMSGSSGSINSPTSWKSCGVPQLRIQSKSLRYVRSFR